MELISNVFVICRDRSYGDPYFYSKHGYMGGVSAAIGYDEKAFAKKFLTMDDAWSYIRNDLPEWGRTIHHPEELTPYEILLGNPALFAALLEDDAERIRLELELPGNRMLIWRR